MTVALGYGVVKNSGKSLIFQNTPGSVDQLDQLPLNPVSATDTATDPEAITVDQLDQLEIATDTTDPQMIHEMIQAPPLQGAGLKANDPTDPDFATSEKIENQNVSDCIKFIRSAVEAAKFVKFAADQVATLYTEFSDRTALAPNLTKILLAAERKGGKISIRDAQLAFTSKFRPSAQMTRSWFGELVVLGYGVVQKSGTGKSLIFEITSRLQEQSLQQPSNSIPVNISASTTTDPTTISCLQAHSPTVGVVGEMIHSRLQTEPIQEESLRSVVGDDPVDDHPSEKIENQNVSDCVKFIRTAISDNDPQVAQDIQAILREQAPEEKQQIWDALTAAEKSAFKSFKKIPK